ncbi:MAG: sulfatase-like hydrolase/transferase [Spirochaetia bacterium]
MKPSDFRRFAVLLGCLYGASVLFNLLLGSYSWLPGHRWGLILVPVPESVAVVLLVFGISRMRSPAGYRLLIIMLSSLFLVIFLFNIGQTFFRYVYRRDFDPFTHLGLVPEFFAMVFRSDLIKRPLFITAASVSAAGLLGGGFFLLFSLLRRLFVRLVSPAAGLLLPLGIVTAILFSPSPVLTGVLFRKLLEGPADFTQTVPAEDFEAVADPDPDPAYAFPGIEDADIYLFVIESYGHTVFTNPAHYKRLAEFYRDINEKLSDAGFAVYTTVYESTTFGGTSWLADSSLITGIKIDTQAKFNTVLEEGTRNLTHILGEKGYTTVFSSPATKAIPDDQKRFYSFSRFVLSDDFGYQGPYFVFGDMPDQFQINHIRKNVLPELESPLFIEFMLVSSHVPWNYIPPVIEDWSRIDDGSIYYDRSRNTFYDNSWAMGSELFEGYTHSIRYVLDVITDYLANYITGDDLVILVGDHQPKFPLSEEDAGFGVPLHIISRNRDYLKPFSRFGYVTGFIPLEGEVFYGLESFLGHFLSVAMGTAPGLSPRERPVRIPPSPSEVP